MKNRKNNFFSDFVISKPQNLNYFDFMQVCVALLLGDQVKVAMLNL